MIDIYMTDARFHVDEPKAEMDVALLLDSILSGRTTTIEEGCIWPSMWESTLSKGLILTLSGDTDLRITPTRRDCRNSKSAVARTRVFVTYTMKLSHVRRKRRKTCPIFSHKENRLS